MTYIESIMRELPPGPASPLGPKPTARDEVEARQCEARRLGHLLEENSEFSFLRLGDMDLCLLLGIQAGDAGESEVFCASSQTGTQPCGDPGISTLHSHRTWGAFQNSTYLDYYDRIWPNTILLDRLLLKRPAGAFRNPTSQTSLIIYSWMEYEFKSFCEEKRVGFLGAEAGVLEILHRNPTFLEQAKDYWPGTGAQFFLQPRENGSNLDANLDLIKADLVDFVGQNRIDTLFISLGGAAKILCYELAKELNIRCIDFGAMLRALCYLGSDGNRIGRSTHSPFFYRLPFDLVMNAVEKTFPGLQPHELLAKAHAQLILELQKKESGWTSASWEFDFDSDNLGIFKNGLAAYRNRYKKLSSASVLTKKEQAGFLHFCGKHKLTIEGRFFMAKFQAKDWVQKNFFKHLK